MARHWQRLGERDPLWAVLTEPGKRGGRWDEQEFFATGHDEVTALAAEAADLGIRLEGRRALDFGCGVGRVSQALAEHYDEVVGVDIAPAMVERAHQLDRSNGRCSFVVGERPDLAAWPDGSFDLVYTRRVLQHLEPRYAKGYLADMARVLAAGGLLVAQVPSRPSRTPRGLLFRLPNRCLNLYRMARGRSTAVVELYGVPHREVVDVLRDAGLEVLAVQADDTLGPAWVSLRYWARRA